MRGVVQNVKNNLHSVVQNVKNGLHGVVQNVKNSLHGVVQNVIKNQIVCAMLSEMSDTGGRQKVGKSDCLGWRQTLSKGWWEKTRDV